MGEAIVKNQAQVMNTCYGVHVRADRGGPEEGLGGAARHDVSQQGLPMLDVVGIIVVHLRQPHDLQTKDVSWAATSDGRHQSGSRYPSTHRRRACMHAARRVPGWQGAGNAAKEMMAKVGKSMAKVPHLARAERARLGHGHADAGHGNGVRGGRRGDRRGHGRGVDGQARVCGEVNDAASQTKKHQKGEGSVFCEGESMNEGCRYVGS